MMMMVMVTMMVNVCDNDCYLMMKVILVKEVMSCDVSPVAMFLPHHSEQDIYQRSVIFQNRRQSENLYYT